jgi:hypothetical protein
MSLVVNEDDDGCGDSICLIDFFIFLIDSFGFLLVVDWRDEAAVAPAVVDCMTTADDDDDDGCGCRAANILPQKSGEQFAVVVGYRSVLKKWVKAR